MCSLLVDGGGDLQCAEEDVLGYGAASLPNIFQRLAWAFGSAVVGRFEAAEAALLALRAARGALGARTVAYVAVRAALSAETGRSEPRFCTLAPYTDDIRFATFGVNRTMRLVS